VQQGVRRRCARRCCMRSCAGVQCRTAVVCYYSGDEHVQCAVKWCESLRCCGMSVCVLLIALSGSVLVVSVRWFFSGCCAAVFLCCCVAVARVCMCVCGYSVSRLSNVLHVRPLRFVTCDLQSLFCCCCVPSACWHVHGVAVVAL
jgi:hypothetical protein